MLDGHPGVARTWPPARRTVPRRPRCRTHFKLGPPTKPVRTSRADGVTQGPGARLGVPVPLNSRTPGSARPTTRLRGVDLGCRQLLGLGYGLVAHHHDDGKEALTAARHPRLAAVRLGVSDGTHRSQLPTGPGPTDTTQGANSRRPTTVSPARGPTTPLTAPAKPRLTYPAVLLP